MPQPNNYNIQRPNLAGQNQAFGMGANLGQGFAESRQRQAKETQAIEMATAKKTEYDADILEVMNNPTSQSFLKLGLKHGKHLPFIQDQMTAMDSKSKDALVKRAAPAYYALENDNIDAAKGLLDVELEIAKAEGDEAKIRQYQDFKGLLDTDPDQVKFALGAVLYEGMGAEDFEKIIGPSGQEKTAKALSQKASTEAGAEVQKVKESKANVAKIKSELAQVKKANDGKVPEKDRVSTEFKLRKEYSDQTKAFKQVRDSYGRIGASQDNAAGDIALVFNYMKMLDPGSVVRESEFSIAQNADSLPGVLKNFALKIGTGERLNAGQRKMFKKQAEKLFDSSKESADVVKGGISRFAKNMGLNEDNIFYEDAEAVASEGEATSDELEQMEAFLGGGK